MTDEERLRNLERLRDSLAFVLEDVEREIYHILARNGHEPDRRPRDKSTTSDSFSEDKEGFIAP